MVQKNHTSSNPTLEDVQEKFKYWRRTRKSHRPIPTELWEAAVSLSTDYSISQISRELILDYSALKKRVHTKKNDPIAKTKLPDFIELDFEKPATVSQCIVKMHDRSGATMTMQWKGKADFDLLELVKIFWRKGP